MSEIAKFKSIDFVENVIEHGGLRTKKYSNNLREVPFNYCYHYGFKWRKIFRGQFKVFITKIILILNILS